MQSQKLPRVLAVQQTTNQSGEKGATVTSPKIPADMFSTSAATNGALRMFAAGNSLAMKAEIYDKADRDVAVKHGDDGGHSVIGMTNPVDLAAFPQDEDNRAIPMPRSHFYHHYTTTTSS